MWVIPGLPLTCFSGKVLPAEENLNCPASIRRRRLLKCIETGTQDGGNRLRKGWEHHGGTARKSPQESCTGGCRVAGWSPSLGCSWGFCGVIIIPEWELCPPLAHILIPVSCRRYRWWDRGVIPQRSLHRTSSQDWNLEGICQTQPGFPTYGVSRSKGLFQLGTLS